MTKGSEWVDYGMLLDEIRLHRSNAQRQINEYREKGKERDLTKSEYGLYNEEIGKEIALMCLERWCMDFKFSISEIKEMEDNMIQAEKKLPEGLEEAARAFEKNNPTKAYWFEGEFVTESTPLSVAFKAGAEWMKAKMMKDAVEGVVCYGSKGAYIETDFLREYDTDVYGNSGDKARVIVIKEDEK